MSQSVAAPGWSDLILNAMFRGSVGTPPATLYFSLGQSGSITVPVEISGIVRAPVVCSRGAFSGTDTASYPYQSTGTLANRVYMRTIADIFCTGLGSNNYSSFCGMIFDAASGGNLLYVWNILSGYTQNVINGDVVRMGQGCGLVTLLSGGGSSGIEDGMMMAQRGTVYGTAPSEYVWSMYMDWLFRGFDSINDFFDVSTYPNVYLSLWDNADGVEVTQVPRVAVSRTTGSWSAPAYNAPGTNLERKITNSNTITFPAATAGGTYAFPKLKITMSNTPQAFNDTIYSGRLYTFGNPFSFNAGDVFRFPASTLDILLG